MQDSAGPCSVWCCDIFLDTCHTLHGLAKICCETSLQHVVGFGVAGKGDALVQTWATRSIYSFSALEEFRFITQTSASSVDALSKSKIPKLNVGLRVSLRSIHAVHSACSRKKPHTRSNFHSEWLQMQVSC